MLGLCIVDMLSRFFFSTENVATLMELEHLNTQKLKFSS